MKYTIRIFCTCTYIKDGRELCGVFDFTLNTKESGHFSSTTTCSNPNCKESRQIHWFRER